MKLLALFFLILPLYATELVNYHIYDRNDRVDLMLSFDSTYNGQISQKKEKNLILLIFSDLKYSRDELKKLNSQLIDKISLSSKDNHTYIMLQNKQNIDLEVSSINDKFGVRIRAVEEGKTNVKPESIDAFKQELTPKLKSISSEGYDYINYILVMLILVILLIVLWWLKNNIAYKNRGIFKDFNIIFQRFLDKNNQLIVFEHANKRYTMIIGSSNVLLESVEIPQDEILKYPEKSELN